jgi:hypothetical protein
MVKNFLWNVCWFCTAAAGLLVWAPKSTLAVQHLAQTRNDAWTSQRTIV